MSSFALVYYRNATTKVLSTFPLMQISAAVSEWGELIEKLTEFMP